MTTHHCNGLAQCGTHPRWNVAKARTDAPRFPWVAFAPGKTPTGDKAFRTHEEAVAYATAQAHADQLAAIQGATP